MAQKTKKRWSASEDTYLSLALNDGLSAQEVARNLGRTPASVTGRKISLGLDGRFSRSTKAVIETNKVIRAMQKDSDEPEVFELEDGVPMPNRLSRYSVEREKLRATLSQIEPGQSFAMTGNLVNAARLLATSEFPEIKLKIVHTTPDKKFARVFRVA